METLKQMGIPYLYQKERGRYVFLFDRVGIKQLLIVKGEGALKVDFANLLSECENLIKKEMFAKLLEVLSSLSEALKTRKVSKAKLYTELDFTRLEGSGGVEALGVVSVEEVRDPSFER